MRTSMKRVSYWGNKLLCVCVGVTIIAFLALSCLTYVLSKKGVSAPISLFTIQSGSMAPHIQAGSLIVTIRKDMYLVGDVITFTYNNTTTTHRIVSVDKSGDEVVFVTQGDKNSAPDASAVTLSSVIGSVRWTIPLVGYAIAYTRTIQGMIMFIVIPATIVVYRELVVLREESLKLFQKMRRRRDEIYFLTKRYKI